MLWGAMGLTLPPCAPQEQASWVCCYEAIWGSVGLGALWACGLYGVCYGADPAPLPPPGAPQEQASWVCRCEAQWGPVGAVGLGLCRGCYGVLWG